MNYLSASGFSSRTLPPVRVLRTLFVVCAFGTTVLLAAGLPYGIDDLFITLTYARNLVETGFPYWHPDLPPVEGFTSLGHVLLIALAHWAGLEPVFANTAVMLMTLAALCAVLARGLRHVALPAFTVGMLILGLNMELVLWLRCGMDALPYTLTFFLAATTCTDGCARRRFGPAMATALSFLVIMRPEGMIITLTFVVYFWIWCRPAHGWAWSAVAWSLVPVATVVALTLWRLEVFGYPLPNTFYAKAADSRLTEISQGFWYAHRWLVTSFGALTLATLWLVRRGLAPIERAMFVFGFIAIVILSGGDSHPGSRFLLPLLPILALDTARVFDVFARSMSRRATFAITAASVAAMALTWTSPWPGDGMRRSLPTLIASYQELVSGETPARNLALGATALWLERVAKAINALEPPQAPIGAVDVGAIAYVTRAPVLDILGLNDAEIAHLPRSKNNDSVWGNYHLENVLTKEPALIAISYPSPAKWSFDEIARRDARCDALARDLSYRVSGQIDAIEENYLWTSVRASGRDWVLNLLTHKTLFAPPETDGLQVTRSQCLRDFVAACPHLP